jgi:SAM-dependent methyltransferase
VSERKEVVPYEVTSYFFPLRKAVEYSYRVREKIFNIFMTAIAPTEATRVLDVGVASIEKSREVNYFEKLYPYPGNITCAGIEDASFLEKRYPGLKFVLIKQGEKLPFFDKQFDVVFSHAVLEHVGSHERQAFFINELCRCGKSVFITTPYRYFPIEVHTGIPFLHFLPKRIFRKIIKNTAFKQFSDEENLNLLGRKELKRFLNGKHAKIINTKVFCFTSNLIAVIRT